LIEVENLYLDNMAANESVQTTAKKEINDSLYGSTLDDMEKKLIFDTLNAVDGNKARAAQILGVSIRTIRNKLHEYGRDTKD